MSRLFFLITLEKKEKVAMDCFFYSKTYPPFVVGRFSHIFRIILIEKLTNVSNT